MIAFIEPRVLISFSFFFVILLTGFWLSQSERPFAGWMVILHSIFTVLTELLFAITTLYVLHSHPLSPKERLVAALCGGLAIVQMVTGILLSSRKGSSRLVAILHKVLPLIMMLALGLLVFMASRVRG